MSQPRRVSAAAQAQAQQKAQRLRSFRTLLDPTDLLPGHNVADLYSLRHLCLQGGGIPDVSSSSSDGWLRAQAWRVLLGYLSPDKAQWRSTLAKRRAEYYQFVADFLPQEDTSSAAQGLPGKLSERDQLLDQIFSDLSRSRKNAFAFYREETKPSWSCPLAPPENSKSGVSNVPRLDGRHGLLRRLEVINNDYAYMIQQERLSQVQAEAVPQGLEAGMTPSASKPSITLQPASPARTFVDRSLSSDPSETQEAHTTAPSFTDRRWHSLLRILYIYAMLNPSIGYVQGMNEVLFILLYVMGTSASLPESTDDGDDNVLAGGQAMGSSSSDRYLDHANDTPGAHAEADAFWCFSALLGELRNLYDFDGIDHASAQLHVTNKRQPNLASQGPDAGGMGSMLRRYSLRLRWLDDDLWRALREHALDPGLPYYSFRWMACLLSTELSLPSIVRVWDALLAESSDPHENDDMTPSKVDFLVDICCALLTNIRGPLLAALEQEDGVGREDAFSRAMTILQAYPDDDIGPVLEMAFLYRQKRLAAPLTGDAPPTSEAEDLGPNLRDRAMYAFREWRATSTSGGNGAAWLSSAVTPKRPTAAAGVGDDSITSSASPAARFQRYAEAIQTSDAAATLSKTSTNWQAKAMATWTGSRTAQSTPTRKGRGDTASESGGTPSLSELGQSFFQRLRTASEATTSPSLGNDDPIHPATRWSRVPPDFPLPDVHDSPSGKRDHGDDRNKGHFVSVNRLAAANALNGHADGDPYYAALASGVSRSSVASTEAGDLSPHSSPATTSFSRFAHLPSLQHAASAAAGARSPSHAATSSHGSAVNTVSHGPKPLLLQGAARPARDVSNAGSVNGDEPGSRKVSSGPMAANVSPRGSAFTRRRADNVSNGGSSYRDSTLTTTSAANSATRGNFGSDKEEDGWNGGGGGGGRKETPPPVPSPPFKAVEAGGSGPVSFTSSRTGTVNASAFGSKGSPAFAMHELRDEGVVESEEREGERAQPTGEARAGSRSALAFGQVASSADVPLTSRSSLQRKPIRKGSDSTADSFESAVKGESIERSPAGANDYTFPAPSTLSSKPTLRPRGPRQSARESLGLFTNPRSAPVPPGADDDVTPTGTTFSPLLGDGQDGDEVQRERYSLTDEPVANAQTPLSPTMVTPTPIALGGKIRRSSGGVMRTRRTASDKKREQVNRRRGSERGSLAGPAAEALVESGSRRTSSQLGEEFEHGSGSGHEYSEAEAGGMHRSVPRRRRSSNRLAVVGLRPDDLHTIEAGTSLTPSPGPEAGKTVLADELMQLLQNPDDTGEGKSAFLSIHGFDEPQFVSAEDFHSDVSVGGGRRRDS